MNSDGKSRGSLTLISQKALDVLLEMAHSLSDTDPLKQYLLQVISSLRSKLNEPLEIHKGVGGIFSTSTLSCSTPDATGWTNNILIEDFSNITNKFVNVAGVYVL